MVTVPLLVPPALNPSLVPTFGCSPWGCPHRWPRPGFFTGRRALQGDIQAAVSEMWCFTPEEELQGLSVQGENCHMPVTRRTEPAQPQLIVSHGVNIFPSPLLPWQVLCQVRYHLELPAALRQRSSPKLARAPEKTPWLIHWHVIVSPTQPLKRCSRAGVYGGSG